MSVAVAAPPFSAAPVTGQPPLRVMIVDDAVVVRGLVSRWLEEEGFQVVASLRTGRDAVNQIERANPDVVVLDVEMPELDGISALPLLLEKKRDLVVIMASTVTRRNAEIGLRAGGPGCAAPAGGHGGRARRAGRRGDQPASVLPRHAPRPADRLLDRGAAGAQRGHLAHQPAGRPRAG